MSKIPDNLMGAAVAFKRQRGDKAKFIAMMIDLDWLPDAVAQVKAQPELADVDFVDVAVTFNGKRIEMGLDEFLACIGLKEGS